MFLVLFNGGGYEEFGTIQEVVACLQTLDLEDAAEVYGAARLFMFGWVNGEQVGWAPIQYHLSN